MREILLSTQPSCLALNSKLCFDKTCFHAMWFMSKYVLAFFLYVKSAFSIMLKDIAYILSGTGIDVYELIRTKQSDRMLQVQPCWLKW